MELAVNEDKTKYMVMTRNTTAKDNLCGKELSFEQLGDFKYLGFNINKKNNMHEEIRITINAESRYY